MPRLSYQRKQDEETTIEGPVSQTFYSASAELGISAIKGQIEEVDGKKVRVGEKFIKFSPVMAKQHGSMFDGFGMFTTSDPELIHYLEVRAVEVQDVFGPEEYRRRLLPPEVREADNQRTIQSQNSLIKDLQEKLAQRA